MVVAALYILCVACAKRIKRPHTVLTYTIQICVCTHNDVMFIK
jgi:hypothetical protein